jgi:ectoine hydroxylase-related dioxygenase (phytanoyl-CoA dioxygenase family)
MGSPFKLSDEQRTQYRDRGFVMTRTMFEEPLLQAMEQEFRRLWDIQKRRVEATDDRTRHMVENRPFLPHVHEASEVCASFLKHPLLTDVCRQMIGPDVDCLYNQAVIKPPSQQGDNSFAWHQDAYYGIHGSQSHLLDHELLVDDAKGFVCWLAVTRTTIENGTLWVAPGMHRRGLLRHTEQASSGDWDCEAQILDKFPVELNPGQVLIFSKLLPHRSGPNVSQETRMAYQFTYTVPGTLRTPGSILPILRANMPV